VRLDADPGAGAYVPPPALGLSRRERILRDVRGLVTPRVLFDLASEDAVVGIDDAGSYSSRPCTCVCRCARGGGRKHVSEARGDDE